LQKTTNEVVNWAYGPHHRSPRGGRSQPDLVGRGEVAARRRRHVDEDLRPVERQHLRDREVPEVFAHRQADPGAQARRHGAEQVAGREEPSLVEQAVRRQEQLAVDVADLAVLDERRGDEQPVVGRFLDEGDDRRDPARLCQQRGEPRIVEPHRHVGCEVLEQVPGEAEFREDDQVRAALARLCQDRPMPLEVVLEGAELGRQLGKRDSDPIHVPEDTRPCARLPPLTPRGMMPRVSAREPAGEAARGPGRSGGDSAHVTSTPAFGPGRVVRDLGRHFRRVCRQYPVACCEHGGESAAPPQTSQAPSSAAPIDARAYPETAVDCANPPETTDGTNTAKYTGIISQIVAVDAQTVEFHLCTPDVAFLSKLAFASNNIQDSDWLQAHAADKSIVHDAINGTGPYQLKEWIPGDHLTLEANPNYWGEAPKVPTVVWRWSKEPAQRLQELNAGTTDGIDNLGTDDFPAVEGNANLQLKPREALNVLYLAMNVGQAPWDNEKVRQANRHGHRRRPHRRELLSGRFRAGGVLHPCAIPGGCEGTPWYDVDPAAAKQALTDAGFDFSKKYQLHYRTQARSYLGDPNRRGDRPAGPVQGQPRHRRRARRREGRHLPQRRLEGQVPDVPAGLGRGLPGCDQLPRRPLRQRRELGHGSQVR
jgi:hypothetical protein